MAGFKLYPNDTHVFTSDASFSVSYDGRDDDVGYQLQGENGGWTQQISLSRDSDMVNQRLTEVSGRGVKLTNLSKTATLTVTELG